MKVAILNCSNIAKTRTIPAFKSIPSVEIVMICSRELNIAKDFAREFNIPKYTNNPEDITSDLIDLVYISSPPELHYSSIRNFLLGGINVLCEKSLTTDIKKTKDIIRLANSMNLIVQENYAFQYHPQWKWIKENLYKIGKLQTIRSAFEFPPRDEKTDFRYDTKLGGGALLDAGGYPIKIASLLMDKLILEQFGSSNMINKENGVDITGSCYLVDNQGVSAYLTWSFDSTYKCFVEISGSDGWIRADKIFTPKTKEDVIVRLKTKFEDVSMNFQSDQFRDLIEDLEYKLKIRDNSHHQEIIKQSKYQSYAKITGIGTFAN